MLNSYKQVLICTFAALLATPVIAAQVELQLVVHDQPDTTVDKMEQRRPIASPVSTPKGVEMRTIGVDVVCWARNVMLDGKPVFERYHDGKYIDRLPIARSDLPAGDHTIWPGNHVFTVAKDGTLNTKSDELLIVGTTVKIKCYPVTLRAFRANPEEAGLPRSMRTAQLPTMTIRESTNVEASAQKDAKIKLLELVPVFEKFAPLNIWLPANTTGKGYVVHPLALNFHLNAAGIKPVSEVGKEVQGLELEKNSVSIPLYGFPFTGQPGANVIITGVEELQFNEQNPTTLSNWYPRTEPYEIKIAENTAPLKIDGDPRTHPFKSFAVDIPDPGKPAARILAVEFDKRHADAGGPFALRMQAVDSAKSGDASVVDITKATPIARVQAYGNDSAWTEVPAKAGAGNEIVLSIPDVSDGIYRLRTGLLPQGSERPITIERWISIAKARNGAPIGVGLFTQRGRTAFQRGESFWIGVSITGIKEPVAVGGSLEMDLIDARGQRMPVLREKTTSAITDRETFIARLAGEQSLGFAAGNYTVEARVGSYASRPLSIALIDPEPATHFTNMLTGKYNPQGEAYAKILRNGTGADELARSLAEMGHNAFQGMSYDLNRVVRKDIDIEQVARERVELGPWESYYQPSGRDKWLDAAVRRNLRFYEDLMTYNDTMLPRDQKILDAISRYTSLETASQRFSPAFKGVCLYDEIYSVADTGTPMSAHFLTAQELNFRAKHPGLTSADSLRALDRYVSRPYGQRKYEDLEKFRAWPAYEDSEWGVLSNQMASAAKTVMPDSQNFTLQRFWGGNGGNLAPNGTASDVFAPLDVAACVMYKDGGYGDRPVFAPMQADVLRTRDNLPVWTQLHTFHAPGLYGKHLLRQAFFAISQKIDGLTYFSIDADHLAPSALDNHDAMKEIADRLCTRYGDLFMALQRGYKKVAIYYSRESDYLESKKPNSLPHACEGLWVACMRAGFPADFLFDDQIRAGRGSEYDVVFAPGFYFEDETPPETLNALRKLVNAGKTVVVERSSKLPIEGIQRLDSDLDEYDDKMGGAFPRHVDFESEMVWNQSEETTKIVRAFLTKRIQPAAIHNLLVGPDWLRGLQGEYMVLPNFAFTGFSGLHKTLYQAPEVATLRFPKRPPICYDMLEMKRVEVQAEGDWMSLQADFRECPGKIFAFLPSEIASVDLRAPLQLRTNSSLTYSVSIDDSNGKRLEAALPLQITIVDAGGTVLSTVYRTANPVFSGVYHLPANLPSGNVLVKVRELISGKTAEASVAVTAGALPLATLDTADVHIGDDLLMQQFLADKTPIVIALDAEQGWCKDEAERLRAALEKRGHAARIASVDSVLRLPLDWNNKAPIVDGSRLWRGDVVEPGLFVDAPLILIGKRYDNRLIEALVARGVFAETLSDNFPGRGRALLGCVHRAFSNQFNAITVWSNNTDGLHKAIEALLSEKLTNTHGARPTTKAPSVDAAAQLIPAKTTGSEPTSFIGQQIVLDHIRAMDVDAASGRSVVGTFGYGHNLFCFGADGKLLWKQFLPEHDVYSVQWYADGKRLVAATGQGNFVFVIDAADGHVLRKLLTSEWPQFHYSEGAVETNAQILVNKTLKQILVRGLTGILALDYDGNKQWYFDRAIAIASYPEKAEQLLAAAFGSMASVGNIALSHDGKRIAYSETQLVGTTVVMNQLNDMWGHRPKILDATNGSVLLENTEDSGSSTDAGGWSIGYSPDSSDPFCWHGNSARALQEDGKLGPVRFIPPGDTLPDGSVLQRDVNGVARTKTGIETWNARDLHFWLTADDRINAHRSRLYRCSWDGVVRCYNLGDGKILWEVPLGSPAQLRIVEAAKDSDEQLLAGGKNGVLVKINANGKELWRVVLREQHQAPDKNYPAYVAAAVTRDPDITNTVFAASYDQPHDYDTILRLGIEQLTNGDFESAEGWKSDSGKPKLDAPGHSNALPGAEEGRALNLSPGLLVTQQLNRRVIPSATYLLEFFYRVEVPNAKVVAGGMLKGTKETLTASKFGGEAGTWQFGRLALKTYEDTTGLDIGFESEGGAVHVDKVSLRAVRFPSANLLANSELHQIEPTFVKDVRVRYNKIPSTLREKLLSRNHINAYKQGNTTTAMAFTQEEAFLHNGRLDDVGQVWTYMPDAIGFSATLTKPAYVSHIVIYLNNATPQNVYETLSVMSNRLEMKDQKLQGMPRLEALVRCNQRRFIVVNFPKPILTDSIKILPGKHPGRHECITEIELYGPLGGETAARAGSEDPQEVPMFMGTAARVPSALPSDVTGVYQAMQTPRNGHPMFLAGATSFNGLFAYPDPAGSIRSLKMITRDPHEPPPQADPKNKSQRKQEDRVEEGPNWPLMSVTPTTTPAHYSGRLLVGSADSKMHAIADNGTYLWGFNTGGRVYSSPLTIGDDVYFGSDDGKLYKVDVDSGSLIWEFATNGKVRAAPAMDGGRIFVTSFDGNLYAVNGESGLIEWKAPLAKFSRSGPAVHGGKVFVGDEAGDVRAFDWATGRELWKHAIGGYVSHAPVVAVDQIIFASEQGSVALITADGNARWKRELNLAVTGQPIATETQILIPTEKGLVVLKRSDGHDDERFTQPANAGKITSVLEYRGRLYLTTASAIVDFKNPPRTYVNYSGGPVVWTPKVEAEDSK